MKYVPSAMFNENLMRKIRFQHPTEIFGSPSFEIDEQGHPWYICSTYTYKGVGAKKQVTGAIFLDPITGESTKYEAGNIPSWAIVFSLNLCLYRNLMTMEVYRMDLLTLYLDKKGLL